MGDGIVTNADRAEYARRILNLSPYDEDVDGACVDILTNLMHYCREEGQDFSKFLNVAEISFSVELEEEKRDGR